MIKPRNRWTGRRTAADKSVTATLLVFLGLAIASTGALAAAPSAKQQKIDLRQGVAAFKGGAYGIALAKLRPLAKANNVRADYWLGRLYEDGLGVKQDTKKAITLYRKAAKAGRPKAELRLGEIYFSGTETLQDFTKAHKWLERAAFDSSRLAQRDLGRLYANGWGVRKDPIWAYVWFEFAARQGDYKAQQQRDHLLKTMSDDQIAEAQKLTRKIAPDVFGGKRHPSTRAGGIDQASTIEYASSAS